MIAPTWAEWDALTSLFINLGFGSSVVAALIWFLQHFVRVTLPQQQQAFTDALHQEREARRDNTERIIRALRRVVRVMRRNHASALDRIDVAFKQLVAEVVAARAERAAGAWTSPRPKDATEEHHQ